MLKKGLSQTPGPFYAVLPIGMGLATASEPSQRAPGPPRTALKRHPPGALGGFREPIGALCVELELTVTCVSVSVSHLREDLHPWRTLSKGEGLVWLAKHTRSLLQGKYKLQKKGLSQTRGPFCAVLPIGMSLATASEPPQRASRGAPGPPRTAL